MKRVYDILSQLGDSNWLAVGISIVSLFLLVLIKFQVSDRFKKQLHNVPVPIDLALIVCGSAAAYFAGLDKKFNLAIVGHIPTG